MLCPVCKLELQRSERQGVEIDYCPECRGVWLDRGELDKIIERSAPSHREPAGRPEHRPPEGHREGSHQGHRPQPRKSFLGEVFDFD